MIINYREILFLIKRISICMQTAGIIFKVERIDENKTGELKKAAVVTFGLDLISIFIVEFN
jgi:hypothetical protein